MIPKTRREFSPEFKREAVALLESSGRPLMQGATEVGISPSMLRNLRMMVRGGPFPGKSGRSGAASPSGLSPMPSAADPGVADHAVEAGAGSHAHGARRAKKPSQVVARLCAVETACVILDVWRAVADRLLEGLTPLKNVAHGLMRT